MVFLRFVGVVNAAIWFGAAIFFTLAVAPTFFSPELTKIIQPPYNGFAVQLVIKRFFIVQHICGVIALLHLLAEWLYMGKPLQRITLGLLLGIFCCNLAGGFWLQPKMSKLHWTIHRGPMELRPAARKSFSAWHGVSQAANLLVTAGLLFYLWRVTSQVNATRLPQMRKLSLAR